MISTNSFRKVMDRKKREVLLNSEIRSCFFFNSQPGYNFCQVVWSYFVEKLIETLRKIILGKKIRLFRKFVVNRSLHFNEWGKEWILLPKKERILHSLQMRGFSNIIRHHKFTTLLKKTNNTLGLILFNCHDFFGLRLNFCNTSPTFLLYNLYSRFFVSHFSLIQIFNFALKTS